MLAIFLRYIIASHAFSWRFSAMYNIWEREGTNQQEECKWKILHTHAHTREKEKEKEKEKESHPGSFPPRRDPTNATSEVKQKKSPSALGKTCVPEKVKIYHSVLSSVAWGAQCI